MSENLLLFIYETVSINNHKMIKSHINAIENILIAQSKTATNAGHPNLRGGPREWFIRDFLSAHLPSTLEIGQGEIIDSDSIPNPPRGNYRPQVDVVLYRKDLPKISYSKSDYAYLAEGVMATIESKSTITSEELKQANKSSVVHNKLTRAGSTMLIGTNHKLYSYAIAYEGPASMSTVASWMINHVTSENWIPNQMVDMVVVLGKGVLWNINSFSSLPVNNTNGANWAYIDQKTGNLLTLFTHMLTWTNSTSSPPNTLGYVKNVRFSNIQLK